MHRLVQEYDHALAYTAAAVGGLGDGEIVWRPNADSSAIGWHLGHQAAVSHYLVRNLTAAEPPIDPTLDRLFDSATPEPGRGDLPPVAEILAYRAAAERRVRATIGRILRGDVAAPRQLARVAGGLLRVAVNHEYQHDAWILEVRAALGRELAPITASTGVVTIDGYSVLEA